VENEFCYKVALETTTFNISVTVLRTTSAKEWVINSAEFKTLGVTTVRLDTERAIELYTMLGKALRYSGEIG
jgi:hypothetical protein